MIDLRSDTQTKPSPGMREAMASAEVGDEQRREDPTVLALEERAARFLGQEEAVYVPTATIDALGTWKPSETRAVARTSSGEMRPR